jgi:hypothetical protein
MERTLFSRRVLILMLILAMAACAAPQGPPLAAPSITKPQAPPISPKDILGAWKGTSPDGQPAGMVFGSDGKITVTIGSESNDGTYTVVFSMIPGRLDIQGSWLDGASISTLIEVVDKNRLRIENSGPGQPRPRNFTSDSTIFTNQ